MNIEKFIAARQPVWNQLEHMLQQAEDSDRTLTMEELRELVQLYRRACSDLNAARSYTANPELLGQLNQLTGRAYRFVYQAGNEKPVLGAFVKLVKSEIPATFRRERLFIAAAAGAMLLGIIVGMIAVLIDPANGPRLIPDEFFTEKPSERVAKIEKEDERIDSVEKAMFFGASLYTHNIRVSFLAFSLGALTFIGGLWLLFYNGVIFGAIATMYALDGVTTFFFAWVGPHGALELPAIVFGGAAGLVMGRAFLTPGDLSRGASLRRALPSVWRMMIAAALTLILAGLIEGSFSQFSSRMVPYSLKIAVAVLLFVALMAYLFVKQLSAQE
ncbi:MAG TPA: stage II sporulation protein M [Thermoanaerobaculia bacterium]|nr:stage II sporulation protein M [Thermoanaerobaculia bacterium]